MNFSPIDNSRPIASECTLMKAEGMPKAENNVSIPVIRMKLFTNVNYVT